MNGRLPAVPTFSLAPAAAYGSAPSHTPPVSGADGLLGTASSCRLPLPVPPSVSASWAAPAESGNGFWKGGSRFALRQSLRGGGWRDARPEPRPRPGCPVPGEGACVRHGRTKRTGAPRQPGVGPAGCRGRRVPDVGLRLSTPRLPRDVGRQLWGRPREGIGLGEAWDGVAGEAGSASWEPEPAPDHAAGGPISPPCRRSTPRITRAITSLPAPRPPWAPLRAWQVCVRCWGGEGGCIRYPGPGWATCPGARVPVGIPERLSLWDREVISKPVRAV